MNRRKVPHHFRLKQGGPFAFAGVWDAWRGEGQALLLSCAIITVPANDLVRPLHDRMPAILMPELYDKWLDPGTPVPELLGVLKPLPAEMLDAVKVGPAASEAAGNGAECLTPAGWVQHSLSGSDDQPGKKPGERSAIIINRVHNCFAPRPGPG